MAEDELNKDPAKLIELAKKGNKQAFDTLYDLYFTPVYRYIYLRVNSPQEAESLAQDVFLKIYQSIHRFKDEGKEPLRYFFTVARNAIIDQSRKAKHTPVDLNETEWANIPDRSTGVENSIELADNFREVTEALKTLNPEQQEVLILKYINGYSNAEISEMLGKKKDAIRQIQSRGLKALKSHLINK